jgi:hypothetical protein
MAAVVVIGQNFLLRFDEVGTKQYELVPFFFMEY